MWKEHSDICKSDLHVPWTNNVVTSGPMNIHSIIIPTFNISLALGTQGSFIWEPGWGPLVGFKRLLPFFCLHGHFWDESKISCLLLLQMARNWTPRKKKIGITILSWKKTTSALELEIGKKAKAVKNTRKTFASGQNDMVCMCTLLVTAWGPNCSEVSHQFYHLMSHQNVCTRGRNLECTFTHLATRGTGNYFNR